MPLDIPRQQQLRWLRAHARVAESSLAHGRHGGPDQDDSLREWWSHAPWGAEFERRLETAADGGFDIEELKFTALHQGRQYTYVASMQAVDAANATRKSSQLTLEKLGPALPEFVGGSADLTESNLTHWKGSRAVSREDASGNYVNYGVREFGMTALMNGLALHGGFIPYGGTFLVFSDYARNAIRMASLMGLRSIYVLTHDSIGLGEDGPTHQPIEHATALRIIPNCSVWRPCDAAETAAAWVAAVERVTGPSCLLLTRQGVPPQPRSPQQIADIRRGGYVLLEPAGAPEAVIIATGSEISLAVSAATALNARGRSVRVVSMPCADVFLAQPAEYREAVLPAAVRRRVAIEAGGIDFWYRFVGLDGDVIGITSFGASAPAPALFEAYGLTAQAVELRIESYLRG